MNTDLAYLAGYIDGDGCFYIGKNINPIKYRSGIIISSTNKDILRFFQKRFGGGCVFGKKNLRFKTYNIINQWIIGGSCGYNLTQQLLPYIHEKKEDAKYFIKFIGEKTQFVKDELINQVRIYRNTENLVTIDIVKEINNISTCNDFSEEDLAYLAGFIDSECALCISKYKPKNSPNKTYKILLQCNNTKTSTIYWLMNKFGGCCYFVPRKSKNSKHKDQIAWRISSKALALLLPKIRPYLKNKQTICDKLIEFYSTTLPNGGDRRLQKFKDSYNQILQKREDICKIVHLLNSKTII